MGRSSHRRRKWSRKSGKNAKSAAAIKRWARRKQCVGDVQPINQQQPVEANMSLETVEHSDRFAGEQKDIEIKTEPDMDIGETHIKLEGFDDPDNGCFEFVGLITYADSFDSAQGNMKIKTEQEIDSDHGSINNALDGSTKCKVCNNIISTNSSSLETITNNTCKSSTFACKCTNSSLQKESRKHHLVSDYPTDPLSTHKVHTI